MAGEDGKGESGKVQGATRGPSKCKEGRLINFPERDDGGTTTTASRWPTHPTMRTLKEGGFRGRKGGTEKEKRYGPMSTSGTRL